MGIKRKSKGKTEKSNNTIMEKWLKCKRQISYNLQSPIAMHRAAGCMHYLMVMDTLCDSIKSTS